MKARTLATVLKKAVTTFPALSLTGPRQSGKTTLLKELFGKTHQYLNLEDPQTRLLARKDPRGFLLQFAKPVILDEVQYAPDLMSYIKIFIDEDRKPGRWLFTGSQNFALTDALSQSLAGRVAVTTLLPFSLAEAVGHGKTAVDAEKLLSKTGGHQQEGVSRSLEEIILRGLYPEVASHPAIDVNLWAGSYITTYLERDIRNLKQVGDLRQFEIFLRSCAVRTGQILDLTGISREVGIPMPTAKRWLSLLEASYQVFLLSPYFRNLGKRLVKRPKIYFTDTSLAAYFMEIRDGRTLSASPYLGPLFETMVVIDFWKRFLNFGRMPSMYFLQTRDGLEVDLVIDLGQGLHLVEIKSSQTITSSHATSLIRAQNDLKDHVASARVISNTQDDFSLGRGINNFSWKTFLAN
jgi:predicted AAA+ superfamily ATPase